ncbi:MAG: YgjV family protein [Lachnospiraceae bacterium]|nr:YgjV family protein [Lachnospiraceae bacterium]
MELLGQVFGFCAVITSFVIYQQKSRKKFIQFKLAIDLLWTLHFLFIGSRPAFITTALAIFREIVFFNKDKKWAKNRIWIFFFLSMFLTSAILTWKNIYSVIPACASSLTTIAFWSNNVTTIKLLLLPASVGMFIYSMQAHSVAGIVNEIISVLSIITYFAITYLKLFKNQEE